MALLCHTVFLARPPERARGGAARGGGAPAGGGPSPLAFEASSRIRRGARKCAGPYAHNDAPT
jgi:hypothetical protein